DPNELLKQVFSLIQEFQKLSYAIHETGITLCHFISRVL
ncbi:hypothetical protein J864_4138, partial [Acinetobacter baumannii 25750_1]